MTLCNSFVINLSNNEYSTAVESAKIYNAREYFTDTKWHKGTEAGYKDTSDKTQHGEGLFYWKQTILCDKSKTVKKWTVLFKNMNKCIFLSPLELGQ